VADGVISARAINFVRRVVPPTDFQPFARIPVVAIIIFEAFVRASRKGILLQTLDWITVLLVALAVGDGIIAGSGETIGTFATHDEILVFCGT